MTRGAEFNRGRWAQPNNYAKNPVENFNKNCVQADNIIVNNQTDFRINGTPCIPCKSTNILKTPTFFHDTMHPGFFVNTPETII